MNIIAIDLGKFNSTVCFFDSETNEYRFQLIKTEQGYVRTLLKNKPSDLVVMEACTASGWSATCVANWTEGSARNAKNDAKPADQT